MKKLLLSLFVLTAGSASYAQWTEQATGFATASRGINEIDIVNENVVWCVAYDGVTPTANIQDFTRTTDGGATWIPGVIDIGNELANINNLSATSDLVAWVSTIDADNGGKGELWKTEDGGESWLFSNPSGPAITTPSFSAAASFQNVVHFFDANNGLVEGDPISNDFEVYRTTDGGVTWTKVAAASLPNPVNANEFGYNGGNVGAGNLFWFVTSAGKLYRTANMGQTWDKVNTPINDFGGIIVPSTNGRVHFSDINGTLAGAIGILIATTDGGTSYTRYTTSDGGATWSAGTPYLDGYQNMDYIPGTNMLVATGDDGLQYTSAYSTDQGATWTTIDGGTQRSAVAFLNGSTGWAGGFNQDSSTGGIFKYTGTSLGLPGVAPRAQFSATPNPTSGMINVANDSANITEVTVFDLLGKQVYNGKFSAMNQVNVDLGQLTTGSYILKATTDSGASQTIKILKN